MPPAPALDVHASGRLSGTLSRSDLEPESFLFGYAARAGASDAVSLTMPVVADQYDSMGVVHPIFEMNLPEGALLERLRLTFAKAIPDLDSLGLLSIVGRSQIGRLRYALPGRPAEAVPEQDLAQILAHTGAEDLFRDLLARYAIHSGVSGVQPKVLVRESGVPARMTERGATHIVKSFNPADYPELGANEFFCMHAAKEAGIETPAIRLSDDRRILVLDRFDLAGDGTYLGCEDFCVLNGLRSHGRYDGSYELIAKRIGQFVSPEEQPKALEQLFAMVALCCALENGDAHLKNFAVTYREPLERVRLAPAYDLVCTTLYNRRDILALTLEGDKAFPSRAVLVRFGRRACGLGVTRVRAVLERVEHGVESARRLIRRYVRQHPGLERAGSLLREAMSRGLGRSIRTEQ